METEQLCHGFSCWLGKFVVVWRHCPGRTECVKEMLWTQRQKKGQRAFYLCSAGAGWESLEQVGVINGEPM